MSQCCQSRLIFASTVRVSCSLGRSVAFVATLLVFVAAIHAQEVRQWQSADGKHSVQASLVRRNGTAVILKSNDTGKNIEIQFLQLSVADRKYIDSALPNLQNTKKENKNQVVTAAPEGGLWNQMATGLGFKPVLVDGLPCLGTLPRQFMTNQQRGNRNAEQDQLQLLLSWHCCPESTRDFSQRLKAEGTAATRKYSQDAIFCNKAVAGFASGPDYKRYREMLRDELAGEQLSEIVSGIDRRFRQTKFGSHVELYFASRIQLRAYDLENNTFTVSLAPVLFSKIRGDTSNPIDVTYLPETPEAITINVTPDEARALKAKFGEKPPTLLAKVQLSNPRSGFVSQDRRTRAVTAKVMSLALYAENQGFTLAYQHAIAPFGQSAGGAVADAKPVGGSPKATTDDQNVSVAMKELAQQMNLNLFNGALAIQVDVLPQYTVKADRRRFGMMLDRFALANQAGHFSPLFAAAHFPEAIGSLVVVTAREGANQQGYPRRAEWIGRDEFEKRDAEQKFHASYGEKLEKLKIKEPLRIALLGTQRADYDFKREGFYLDLVGRSNWLQFNGNSYRLPQLPSQRLRIGELKLQHRPCYFRSFVPVAPEDARGMLRSSGSVRAGFFPVAAVVTIDQAGWVDLESVTVFRDKKFKNKLTEFEIVKAPLPYSLSPELARLPDKETPPRLDRNLLVSLLAQETGTAPSQKLVSELFLRQASKEAKANPYGRAFAGVRTVDRDLSIANVRSEPAQHLEKTRAKLEEAKQDFTKTVKHQESNFFSRYNVSKASSAESKIHSVFLEWNKRRTESSGNRFVVNARVVSDPLTQTAALYFSSDLRSLSADWSPVQQLLAKGVSKGQLAMITNYVSWEDGGRGWEPPVQRINDPSERLIDPIIQFTQSTDRIAKSIPFERIRGATKNHRPEIICQITIEVGETELIESQVKNGKAAFVVHAEPVSLKLFENRGEKWPTFIYEGDLNKLHLPVAKKESVESKTLVENKSSEPIALTSSLVPWVVAKHKPELFEKFAHQVMIQRWKQEQNFRGNPRENKVNLDPKLGIYFPENSSKPAHSNAVTGLEEFKKWTTQRAQKLGNRFTLSLKSRFGAYEESAKGFPLVDRNIVGRHDAARMQKVHQKRITEITAQIAKQPKRPTAPADAEFGDNDYLIQDLAKNKRELEKFKQVGANLNIGPRYILPSEEVSDQKNRYEFIVPALNGARRAPPKQNDFIVGGTWDPDAALPSDPLLPLLFLDQEIWLPTGSEIARPGDLEFTVEIDFEVVDCTLEEEPSSYGEDILGKQASRSGVGDEGSYAVFSITVRNAWILHPRTKERHVQLVVKPIRRPTPLKDIVEKQFTKPKQAAPQAPLTSESNPPAEHTGSIWDKSDSQKTESNSPQHTGTSIWDQAETVFVNDFSFSPVLVDGVPCIGRFPRGFLNQSQQKNRAREQKQIGMLLSYLADNDCLTRFLSPNTKNASQFSRKQMGQYTYGQQMALEFGHAFSKFSQDKDSPESGIFVSGKVGDKEKKTATELNQLLKKIEGDQPVELNFVGTVQLREYANSRLPMKFDWGVFPENSGLGFGSVKFIYDPDFTKPETLIVSFEEAKNIATRLKRRQAAVVVKVRLANLTHSSTPDGLSENSAEVEVIGVSLRTNDRSFQNVFQWSTLK